MYFSNFAFLSSFSFPPTFTCQRLVASPISMSCGAHVHNSSRLCSTSFVSVGPTCHPPCLFHSVPRLARARRGFLKNRRGQTLALVEKPHVRLYFSPRRTLTTSSHTTRGQATFAFPIFSSFAASTLRPSLSAAACLRSGKILPW